MVARTLLIAGMALALVAQPAAPTVERLARISAPSPGPLAFVGGGQYLIVATGGELQLFDTTDARRPVDVASMPLDGDIRALAAASDFALAAVEDGGEAELLVLAPDPYAEGGFGMVNFLPAPDAPRWLGLSPDHRWAVAAGGDEYIVLDITAPESIESSPPVATGDAPVMSGVLGPSFALLLREGESSVERLDLTTARDRPRPRALALDAPPTAVALAPGGETAAVALRDNRVVLFDPERMVALRTLTPEDGPAGALAFLADETRQVQVLALLIPERSAVMLVDASAEAALLPGSAASGAGSARAIAAEAGLLALADDDGVTMFALRAP